MLMLVDAFLLASVVAYYLSLLLPKPVLKDSKNIWVEKLAMVIYGSLLLGNLLFNVGWGWFLMGVFWVFGAGVSYLGYAKWNVLWREDVSDEAQMVMFVWNLLIAIACFIKF